MISSSLLLQLGACAAALSAIIGAFYLLHRAFRSMQTISLQAISAAVDASRTGHLVDYHLGPNGTATPLHVRLGVVETSLHGHRLTEQKDEQ